MTARLTAEHTALYCKQLDILNMCFQLSHKSPWMGEGVLPCSHSGFCALSVVWLPVLHWPTDWAVTWTVVMFRSWWGWLPFPLLQPLLRLAHPSLQVGHVQGSWGARKKGRARTGALLHNLLLVAVFLKTVTLGNDASKHASDFLSSAQIRALDHS